MIIDRYHHHIDNGGISIEVRQSDDEYKNIELLIETSYFGYPSVAALIRDYGHIDSKVIEEIGLFFIRSAGKLRKNNDE